MAALFRFSTIAGGPTGGCAVGNAEAFRPDLNDRIRAALAEDLGPGDVTSEATIPPEARGRAVVRIKAPGCLCGIPVAMRVFAIVDERIRMTVLMKDGLDVKPGDEALRVEGHFRSILSAERLALNFLQWLSGIATLTQRYVRAVPPGISLAICDTRKTTPLWRDIERYAVRVGGGLNHRWGLGDMVMIKDTHSDASGGLGEALERVQRSGIGLPIAAEARTLEEALLAARSGVNLLMLDNMNDDEIAQVIGEIRGKCQVEVTGGVTPDRLARLAQLGVNRVSVGALTHSAPALDISLDLECP